MIAVAYGSGRENRSRPRRGSRNSSAWRVIACKRFTQSVLNERMGKTSTLIAGALNVLGQQATALAGFPVPPCADPHGYFATLLSRVVTVTGEVGPGATLADLQQAVSQLGSVFSLESDFTAEVKQTTGS